jgi:hypothetical protein
MAWVLAAAIAVLAPALSHGAAINDPGNAADQIDAVIPWTTLVWTEVHHGFLPLWNPYNALGLPLAFNWQSAPLSIPTLLGYLFPLRLAFTVQIIVTLIITGTGMYALGRTLRLGVIGCVFAATVYELSGAFMGWLGQPPATVMSWAGWLFAAAILVVRGRRRARSIAAFAVVLGCAIYAGDPETLIQLLLALAVFLVVLLVLQVRSTKDRRSILRPTCDLVLAGVAGAALGAPLALPGVQLAVHSVQSIPSQNVYARTAYSLNGLVYGFTNGTYTNGAYIGLISIVLAVLALAFYRHRPEVVGLGVVAVAATVAAFASPVVALLNRLPGLDDLHWQRVELSMAFAIALLAGAGLDTLVVASSDRRAAPRWAVMGFALACLGLLVLFIFGTNHLDQLDVAVRTKTFLWRAAEAGIGLAIAGVLLVTSRRPARSRSVPGLPRRRLQIRWLAAWTLLACETAFLVAAGAPFMSSGPTALTPTRYYMDLQKAVGTSLMGFGNTDCFPDSLGILQDVNIVYGVHELAVLDPITPAAYDRAWRSATGMSGGPKQLFCPAVTTATVARRFGVSFVLEPVGAPGPQGAVLDEASIYSQLYRIPRAASATLVPLTSTEQAPGPDAAGSPVPVTHPNPAAWRLDTNSTRPGVLRLRLTDVPGWHATIDGRPLSLQQFSGIMLEARIPAGRHTIELHYWPEAFTVGIVLAACAAAGLLLVPMVAKIRILFSRRHPRVPHGPPS